MNEYYHVIQIEGKGLGCVALKKIRIGKMILQEKPQMIVDNSSESWKTEVMNSYRGKSLLESLGTTFLPD